MAVTTRISETAFCSTLEGLFNSYGWRWAHFRVARTDKGWRTPLSGFKGFPDYVAVRDSRLIFAEIKDNYAKLSDDQADWLEDLKNCQRAIITEPLDVRGQTASMRIGAMTKVSLVPEVYLWRPRDYEEVKRILEWQRQ